MYLDIHAHIDLLLLLLLRTRRLLRGFLLTLPTYFRPSRSAGDVCRPLCVASQCGVVQAISIMIHREAAFI